MNDNLDEIELRRRRLHWRANHRGIRELDLLVGGFASERLNGMSQTELDEFEAIVASPDCDLHDWLLGRLPVPRERMTAMMTALMTYRPEFGLGSGDR